MSARLSKYQQFRRKDETSARQVDEKVQRERKVQRDSLKRKIDDVTKQVSAMNARKEKLKTQLVTIEEQIERLDEEIKDAQDYIDDLARRLRNFLNSENVRPTSNRNRSASMSSRRNSGPSR
jgi:archaellum component FlaC